MTTIDSISLLESPVADVQKRASIVVSTWLESHESLCGLELRRSQEDQWAVILPNPSSTEAPFKLQRFWVRGFLAHTAYVTPDAALQAAFVEGYTETAKGTLDRLALSEGWRSTYGNEMGVTPDPVQLSVRHQHGL
jgi:hypothetical protein